MRTHFIDTVVGECATRDDLMVLSGDAGLGVFDGLQRDFPDRFLNLGIAEQNMAGFAAGMALSGVKVFVYNIIPFVLYRCYEQVRNDICQQRLPVVLVGTGSGITYAPAGVSHYAVEDIGLARTLPNLTVISPADPLEAKAAACYALTAREPVYVRLAKSGEPALTTEVVEDITAPRVVSGGGDIAILFHGSIADEVVAARDALAAEGVRPMLVSVPLLQPLQGERLRELLKGVKGVISVEEHFAETGLGGILKCLYATVRPPWSLRTLGVPDRFIHDVCDRGGMRVRLGISSADIAAEVREMRREIAHG